MSMPKPGVGYLHAHSSGLWHSLHYRAPWAGAAVSFTENGRARVLCWNATETSSSPRGIGTLRRSNPSPLLAARSITRVKSLKKLSGDSLGLSRKETRFRTKKLQKLIGLHLEAESEGVWSSCREGKPGHVRTCWLRNTYVTWGWTEYERNPGGKNRRAIGVTLQNTSKAWQTWVKWECLSWPTRLGEGKGRNEEAERSGHAGLSR